MDWSGRIFAALAIFVIGRLLMRGLTNWATAAMRRVGVDDTLSRFLGNLLYMVLLLFLGLTVFSTLGVPTTNFLAIVGAAGLAVGLALKDSLSNFSSGVMLVFFRPFKVGDQIDAAGVGGVVESIGIFNVVLKTPDNRVITVPNSLDLRRRDHELQRRGHAAHRHDDRDRLRLRHPAGEVRDRSDRRRRGARPEASRA